MADSAILSERNGVRTSVHRDGRARHFLIETSQRAHRDFIHDCQRERSAGIHHNGRFMKKLASIPMELWVKWSLEAGVPLNSMNVDERSAFIRRKLRDMEYEKIKTCEKV